MNVCNIDFQGNKKCESYTVNCQDRMGSEKISDDTIESLAYEVCNTDGVEGLSKSEVDLCEVTKYKYEDTGFPRLTRFQSTRSSI